MSALVIDNSVVLAWWLDDEADAMAEAARHEVTANGGWVPRIWWYELRNALIVNERRGRLDAQITTEALADLSRMPIQFDDQADEVSVLDLARSCSLSVYDAAYLEVARRRSLSLATLDQRLADATHRAGVQLFKKAI